MKGIVELVMTAPPSSERTQREASLDLASVVNVASLALWPIAILTFIHKTLWVPYNDSLTDDFTTVISALQRFVDGVPVYNEQYWTVDPHYLYSPGATLLLSPLAWLPEADASRTLYILLNAVAAVAALMILTRMFGKSLRGPVLPLAIAGLFSTESVTNTLLFSNNNGLLLLIEVGFLWALLANRALLAGVLIGVAILIKPQFAPLLVIPLFRKQWSALIGGLGVPVVFNLAALPLMQQPMDYFNRLLPYLGETRDYANSAIAGLGAYYGWPEIMTLGLRGIAALFVGVALLLLLRYRNSDPLFWMTSTTSLILIGVFLLSSLGQMYYSMLAVPMIFTIFLRRSLMHNPVMWLGIYVAMAGTYWFSDAWPWAGRTIEHVRGTVGWSLIVISAATTLVVWLWYERKQQHFSVLAASPLPSPADRDNDQ